MLRRHKNALLHEILRAGLNPTQFSSEDEEDDTHPSFTIGFDEAERLFFTARNPKGHFDDFDYRFIEFAAGYPLTDVRPEEGYVTFDQLLSVFREWLDVDVRHAAEDAALPDLWSRVSSNEGTIGGSTALVNVAFTADERAQVRAAVETFRVLLIQTFAPSETELGAVNAQLSYLGEAVDRLNMFDWQGTALNTLLSIGITLSLDTERGRELFGIFQQAFGYVTHLLR